MFKNQFQEGTLKKINMERNRKTTRNLTDGLPFTLEDVEMQYSDVNLKRKVLTTSV